MVEWKHGGWADEFVEFSYEQAERIVPYFARAGTQGRSAGFWTVPKTVQVSGGDNASPP